MYDAGWLVTHIIPLLRTRDIHFRPCLLIGNWCYCLPNLIKILNPDDDSQTEWEDLLHILALG